MNNQEQSDRKTRSEMRWAVFLMGLGAFAGFVSIIEAITKNWAAATYFLLLCFGVLHHSTQSYERARKEMVR